MVGLLYGVALTLGHQLLWHLAREGEAPTLGCGLSDPSPMVQQVILRGFAALSSLITGTIADAISGLIAWAVSKTLPESTRTE